MEKASQTRLEEKVAGYVGDLIVETRFACLQ